MADNVVGGAGLDNDAYTRGGSGSNLGFVLWPARSGPEGGSKLSLRIGKDGRVGDDGV